MQWVKRAHQLGCGTASGLHPPPDLLARCVPCCAPALAPTPATFEGASSPTFRFAAFVFAGGSRAGCGLPHAWRMPRRTPRSDRLVAAAGRHKAPGDIRRGDGCLGMDTIDCEDRTAAMRASTNSTALRAAVDSPAPAAAAAPSRGMGACASSSSAAAQAAPAAAASHGTRPVVQVAASVRRSAIPLLRALTAPQPRQRTAKSC